MSTSANDEVDVADLPDYEEQAKLIPNFIGDAWYYQLDNPVVRSSLAMILLEVCASSQNCAAKLSTPDLVDAFQN